MKNYKLHIIILCCFLIAFIYTATSQENPVMIKYQDSIEGSLLKHNLKLFAYPAGYENFPCPIVGPPKYKIQRPELPGPEEPDPIRIIGDTSLVFLKAEGDKNVFWIHGLNGNTDSWAFAANASQAGVPFDPNFPARKIISYRGLSTSATVQLYSESIGIRATSLDLEGYANSFVPKDQITKHDFIIAHSQGGIVGREWLRNMDKTPGVYKTYANGIVTFGTPHGGAEVLNNCRPNLGRNKLPAFVNEACQSLGGAIIIPKLNANFITSLIPSQYMTDIIGTSCGVLSKSIIPIIMDNYYKPTTKDFYVGATFLEGGTINGFTVQGLNQYTSKVPVVQFYGVEEQPIMWRFMNSTLDFGEILTDLNNDKLYFAYTNDNQLPLKVNNLITDFGANYQIEKEKETKLKKAAVVAFTSAMVVLPISRAASAALLLTNIVFLKKANDAKQNKEAFDRGKVWLTNANDYYLTDLIGARESKTSMQCRVTGVVNCRSNLYNPVGSGVPATLIGVNYTTYPTSGVCAEFPGKVLNWTSYHYSSPWSNSTIGDCSGSIQQVVSGWVTTYSYKDNDGVVLAESAKYPINVDIQAGNTQTFVPMYDTNHDQMKNCTATKTGLTKLYEGDYGKFFKTEIR